MKLSIKEIVKQNIEMAIDQAHEYDNQSEFGICGCFEGDAYLANTTDTLIEEGYDTHGQWEEAQGLFFKMAEEAGLRFA